MNGAVQLGHACIVNDVDLGKNKTKPVYEETYMSICNSKDGFSSCHPEEEIIHYLKEKENDQQLTDDLVLSIKNSTIPQVKGSSLISLLLDRFRKSPGTVMNPVDMVDECSTTDLNKVENQDIIEHQTVTKNTLNDADITMDNTSTSIQHGKELATNHVDSRKKFILELYVIKHVKRKLSKDMDIRNLSERTNMRYRYVSKKEKENISTATKEISAKEKKFCKQTRTRKKSPLSYLYTGALSQMEFLQKNTVTGSCKETSLSKTRFTDNGSQALIAYRHSGKDPGLTEENYSTSKPCRTSNKKCCKLRKEISSTGCFVFCLDTIFIQVLILFIMLVQLVNSASTGDTGCKGSFTLQIKAPDILLSLDLSEQCEINGMTRWEGGPKEVWLTANNSTINDDPKYQPIPRNGIFDLLIRNATAEDYNATYVFLNRFIKRKAYLPDLEATPGNQSFIPSYHVMGKKLELHLLVQIFPEPRFQIFFMGKNLTEFMKIDLQKDGLFYKGNAELRYDLTEMTCNGKLLLTYYLASSSGLIFQTTVAGNMCSDSGNPTVIIVSVVGIFVFLVLLLLAWKKRKKWIRCDRNNDAEEAHTATEELQRINAESQSM